MRCVSGSVVSDSATAWTVAARLLCPWASPGKKTGVGCHSLLQGSIPTQGLNPGIRHCRGTLYRRATREALVKVNVIASNHRHTDLFLLFITAPASPPGISLEEALPVALVHPDPPHTHPCPDPSTSAFTPTWVFLPPRCPPPGSQGLDV